jgi:hypothetical protein
MHLPRLLLRSEDSDLEEFLSGLLAPAPGFERTTTTAAPPFCITSDTEYPHRSNAQMQTPAYA